MYALIILKPFSLEIVNCVICDTMKDLVEVAETFDPNINAESLMCETGVETEDFIFRVTAPQYANYAI